MLIDELQDFRDDIERARSDLLVRIEAHEEMVIEHGERLDDQGEEIEQLRAVGEEEGPFEVRPEEIGAVKSDIEEYRRELELLERRKDEFVETTHLLYVMLDWLSRTARQVSETPEEVDQQEVRARLEAWREKLDSLGPD